LECDTARCYSWSHVQIQLILLSDDLREHDTMFASPNRGSVVCVDTISVSFTRQIGLVGAAVWGRWLLSIVRGLSGGSLSGTVDWRAFLLLGAVAFCSAVAFVALPALHWMKLDVGRVIIGGGRSERRKAKDSRAARLRRSCAVGCGLMSQHRAEHLHFAELNGLLDRRSVEHQVRPAGQLVCTYRRWSRWVRPS
jgi:hypothetical protein